MARGWPVLVSKEANGFKPERVRRAITPNSALSHLSPQETSSMKGAASEIASFGPVRCSECRASFPCE